MSDIRTNEKAMQDAYERHAIAVLHLKTIENRREEVKASLLMLDENTKNAIKDKQKILTAYAGGMVEMAAVTAARVAVEVCEQERLQADEILEAIQQEYGRVSSGPQAARDACRAARDKYCESCAAPIEMQIRTDAKLRRQLLDVYASLCARADASLGIYVGCPRWDVLLQEVFTPPDDAEVMEALERFERKYMQNIAETVA